jgi:hypothetical protein
MLGRTLASDNRWIRFCTVLALQEAPPEIRKIELWNERCVFDDARASVAVARSSSHPLLGVQMKSADLTARLVLGPETAEGRSQSGQRLSEDGCTRLRRSTRDRKGRIRGPRCPPRPGRIPEDHQLHAHAELPAARSDPGMPGSRLQAKRDPRHHAGMPLILGSGR